MIYRAAQLMEIQTHMSLSSPYLINEECNLQNQEHFITVTLFHHLQYLNIVDVQGKPAGRKCHSKEEVILRFKNIIYLLQEV